MAAAEPSLVSVEVAKEKALSSNLKSITTYADSKLRWLFEMMELEEEKPNYGDSQKYSDQITDFIKRDFFIEVKNYTAALAKENPDSEPYQELSNLFNTISGFWP